jgi:hypothetical protein
MRGSRRLQADASFFEKSQIQWSAREKIKKRATHKKHRPVVESGTKKKS